MMCSAATQDDSLPQPSRTWSKRAASAACLWLAAVVAMGCGTTTQPEPIQGFGYSLQVTLGTYSDGSGRLGLAMLTTLRDEEGVGPDEPWQGELWSGDAQLASGFSYDATGQGSVSTFWFPDIPAQAGSPYRIVFKKSGSEALSIERELEELSVLEPTQPDYSSEWETIDWDPIPEVAVYRCRVSSEGSIHLDLESAVPGCDVSALPAGAYQVSILAETVGRSAVRDRMGDQPELPERFSVSESRLGIVKGGEDAADIQLVAAGGPLHYGGGSPGLAIFVELTEQGAPSAEAWELEVSGPGLSPEAPMRTWLAALNSRNISWTYDAGPLPGVYTVLARAGDRHVAAQFSVSDMGLLDIPRDVVVTSRPSGAVDVVWTPAAEARSHFVAVYGAGEFVAGTWTASGEASFPTGSFTAGGVYQVYVTSTDVDLSSPIAPSRLIAAEDAFNPVTFTAE